MGDPHTNMNDRRSKGKNGKLFIVWLKAYHILCFEPGVDQVIIYYPRLGHDIPTSIAQVHEHNKAQRRCSALK
jgi:hypothetical protein